MLDPDLKSRRYEVDAVDIKQLKEQVWAGYLGDKKDNRRDLRRLYAEAK